MTQHRRIVQVSFLTFFLVLLTASGCGPAKSQSFHSSFLPSLPHTNSEPSEQSVPPAAPNLYARETPNPLAGMAAPPKPTETEFRLMRAQERFESGKRAYAQGDLATARQEFDKAI